MGSLPLPLALLRGLRARWAAAAAEAPRSACRDLFNSFMCLDMSSCSRTSVCLLNVDLRSPLQLSLRLSRKLYSRLEGLAGARACRVDDEEAEGPPRRFFWRWLSASKSMANRFKKSVTLRRPTGALFLLLEGGLSTTIFSTALSMAYVDNTASPIVSSSAGLLLGEALRVNETVAWALSSAEPITVVFLKLTKAPSFHVDAMEKSLPPCLTSPAKTSLMDCLSLGGASSCASPTKTCNNIPFLEPCLGDDLDGEKSLVMTPFLLSFESLSTGSARDCCLRSGVFLLGLPGVFDLVEEPIEESLRRMFMPRGQAPV